MAAIEVPLNLLAFSQPSQPAGAFFDALFDTCSRVEFASLLPKQRGFLLLTPFALQ